VSINYEAMARETTNNYKPIGVEAAAYDFSADWLMEVEVVSSICEGMSACENDEGETYQDSNSEYFSNLFLAMSQTAPCPPMSGVTSNT
jgi:hypothetical protein